MAMNSCRRSLFMSHRNAWEAIRFPLVKALIIFLGLVFCFGIAENVPGQIVDEEAAYQHYRAGKKLSSEQAEAYRQVIKKYKPQIEAAGKAIAPHLLRVDGPQNITVKKGYDHLVEKLNALSGQLREELAVIDAWPNGKKPKQHESDKPKSEVPERTKADDIADKIENAASCCPNCPYDDDKILEKLKLTATQKENVERLRKQRQKSLAAGVKAASKKKNTAHTRRALYGVLRFIAALHHYRIRYSFTPVQIDIFDRESTDWQPPTFEDLTQGEKPENILIGNEDEVNRDLEKRLTRTNFYKYQEFKSMLAIDDELEMKLTGFDSESQGVFKAATERLEELKEGNASRGETDFVIKDCDKQFAKIQKGIRMSIARGQRESFYALSLLLFDALEFPAQNMASFDSFDLAEQDVKKVKDALMLFLDENMKAVVDPSDVSVSRQETMQKELENKVKAVLPAKVRVAWDDAGKTYPKILDAVKKYKSQ